MIDAIIELSGENGKRGRAVRSMIVQKKENKHHLSLELVLSLVSPLLV